MPNAGIGISNENQYFGHYWYEAINNDKRYSISDNNFVLLQTTSMKRIISLITVVLFVLHTSAQRPCSSPVYRQFDFWLGEWDAFGKNGQKAGDSKISLILDSCIILEEWTSASVNNSGIRYAGKSFNTYNAITKQWQQTWVDNVGGSTEYLEGKYGDNKIIFKTKPFPVAKDTMAIRRLTFFNLDNNKVRQLGEITKNNGQTWIIEYDLEYWRKKG